MSEALTGLNAQNPLPVGHLITGLAEGADCLVAACAFRLGWRVTAVLALPIEEFERDFSGPESVAEFRALLGRCHRVRHVSATVLARPECYGAVGTLICHEADALLALWDGDVAAASKVGGTAWVVERFKQKQPETAGGQQGLIHLHVQRKGLTAKKAVIRSSASNVQGEVGASSPTEAGGLSRSLSKMHQME